MEACEQAASDVASLLNESKPASEQIEGVSKVLASWPRPFDLQPCVDWGTELREIEARRGDADTSIEASWPPLADRNMFARRLEIAIKGLQLAHRAPEERSLLLLALFAGAEASLVFGETQVPGWRYSTSSLWVKAVDGWLCAEATKGLEKRREKLIERLPSLERRWKTLLTSMERDARIYESSLQISISPVVDAMQQMKCKTWNACNAALRKLEDELKREIPAKLQYRKLSFPPKPEEKEAFAAQRLIHVTKSVRKSVMAETLLDLNTRKRGYWGACKRVPDHR